MRRERGTHPHVPEHAGINRVAAPAFLQESLDCLVPHLGEGVCVVWMQYMRDCLIICNLLTRHDCCRGSDFATGAIFGGQMSRLPRPKGI